MSGQIERKCHLTEIRLKQIFHIFCLLQIMFLQSLLIILLLYSYSYEFAASNELKLSQIGFRNVHFVYKTMFLHIFPN